MTEWGAIFADVRRQIRVQHPGLSEQDVFARAVDVMRRAGLGDAPDNVPVIVKVIPVLAAAGAAVGLVGPAVALMGSARVAQIKSGLAAIYKAAKAAGVAPDLADILGNVAQEVTMQWTKTLWSGVRSVLWGAAALIVPALITGFFSPEVAEYLKAHIPVAGALVSAAFLALGNAAMNWWKNRNKPTVPAQ